MEQNDAERLFSVERMGAYVKAAGGDYTQAFKLYLWNNRISGEFMSPIGHTEVALRNTINRQLSGHYNSRTWYLDNPDLDGKLQTNIEDTLSKIGKRADDPGQVVANLQFGFWRSTLSRDYEKQLWVPSLHKGFQDGTNRKQLARDVTEVNQFRNRIAHHEPIFKTDLNHKLQQINSICETIDPKLAKLVDQEHYLRVSIEQNPLEKAKQQERDQQRSKDLGLDR